MVFLMRDAHMPIQGQKIVSVIHQHPLFSAMRSGCWCKVRISRTVHHWELTDRWQKHDRELKSRSHLHDVSTKAGYRTHFFLCEAATRIYMGLGKRNCPLQALLSYWCGYYTRLSSLSAMCKVLRQISSQQNRAPSPIKNEQRTDITLCFPPKGRGKPKRWCL